MVIIGLKKRLYKNMYLLFDEVLMCYFDIVCVIRILVLRSCREIKKKEIYDL